MAPEGVAFRPVPLAFPQNADPAASASAGADGARSARFSTTSLESLSRFADQDASRMGMSGAESFRFTLRDTRGPMAMHTHAHHPRPQQQPPPQQQPQSLAQSNGVPSAALPPGYISARQSARLPPSRFFYHFNHTNAMLADNARLRERGPGQTVVITPTVLPRVQEQRVYEQRALTYHHPQQPQPQPPQPWQQWQHGTAPLVSVKPAVGVAAGTTVLFPHAFNPGQSESARAHAFDLSGRSAPMAPPLYDSFPLHPQQRLFRPTASTHAQRMQQSQPHAHCHSYGEGSCRPLVPPPAPALALDPRTHRFVPAFSESADRQMNRLALESPSCY